MSIAIYDADFLDNPEEGIYNLQAMKLSTYYKKKKEIVAFITDLNKSNLYSQVFYFQDKEDLNFNPLLSSITNITFCGRAFNRGMFNSLGEEIEKQQPDIYLYYNYMNKISKDKKMKGRFSRLNNGLYAQISIDRENFWPYQQQKENLNSYIVFLNDLEIVNIPNWEEIIQPFFKNELQFLSFVNPQPCYSREQLIKFSHFRYSTMSQPIILKYEITKAELKFIINNFSQIFLNYVLFPFGEENKKGEFLRKEFYDIVNYILYMKSNNKHFKIFCYQQYDNLTAKYFGKYLTQWNNSQESRKLSSFMRFHKQNKQAIKVANLVLKSMPELEKMLNINPQAIHENGGIYLL